MAHHASRLLIGTSTPGHTPEWWGRIEAGVARVCLLCDFYRQGKSLVETRSVEGAAPSVCASA